MLKPNGTLTIEAEYGYVWTTECRKCGTTQRIRVGDAPLEIAREALSIAAGYARECPGGFHVELGGWDVLWSFDLLLEQYATTVVDPSTFQNDPAPTSSLR